MAPPPGGRPPEAAPPGMPYPTIPLNVAPPAPPASPPAKKSMFWPLVTLAAIGTAVYFAKKNDAGLKANTEPDETDDSEDEDESEDETDEADEEAEVA